MKGGVNIHHKYIINVERERERERERENLAEWVPRETVSFLCVSAQTQLGIKHAIGRRGAVLGHVEDIHLRGRGREGDEEEGREGDREKREQILSISLCIFLSLSFSFYSFPSHPLSSLSPSSPLVLIHIR